ncbi:flagellar motor switch phosphatase FliY [Clostridium sp. 'White wine YQ']|uniref:flagellar motor switch phosphatase FliY n=1 Tax=Clostridium sp. 'White wine YQ' TaxID=3027474 RepID=UPI002365BB4D|nr:flagellar motor switch phosphatase FliY [Clostridium sp. 'White wine YQ']MDD7794636.1 flagellar motor switch phosphatase FliY [Clostridium sp. 'White wine YQ']
MSNGFLSQEEIDSLLNGNPSSTASQPEADDDQNLKDIEKDLLGEIGNISMGSASTALSQIINQQVNITTPVVTLTTLHEVKKGFETPNIVLEVEYTSGIVGKNILIMKNSDASVIANLMMGGDGSVTVTELSEIEISAVQEAMNQMIGSAATSMATMFSREVNISPPKSKVWQNDGDEIADDISDEEKVVKVSFRMTIGSLVDSSIMQILPVSTAKKIVAIMMGEEDLIGSETSNEVASKEIHQEAPVQRAQSHAETRVQENNTYASSAPAPVQAPAPVVEVHRAQFEPLSAGGSGAAHSNIDLILDVPLEISVVLGRTKKSIRDILNFSSGSLIELEKLAEEPVEVLVNGKKIAYGEVVVVDENFGVRITSIVSGAERIKSLR